MTLQREAERCALTDEAASGAQWLVAFAGNGDAKELLVRAGADADLTPDEKIGYYDIWRVPERQPFNLSIFCREVTKGT